MKHILNKWHAVVEGIGLTFREKMEQYGPSRFEPHSDQFNYWMCFSDVHRKTLRLESLTSVALANQEQGACSYDGTDVKEARVKLIDDYKDIANYAIMAVMILSESGQLEESEDEDA